MKIYNSYTNEIEGFKTQKEGVVSMYVCGPTTYNYIHIGNARPIIVFDVLTNFLEYIGYEVRRVSNVTDIDDKIINKAIEENKTELEVSQFYTKAYNEDSASLGAPVTYMQPKVTENIENIIEYIEVLIKKGYAYKSGSDVYFRVTKLQNYGSLSNQKLEDLQVGARIEENNKKESPFDFTLWKETEKGITYDSPFGKGRPGWHTECVAMINKIFGEKIDIHCGGSDLMFPHHENEIAQGIAHSGHNVANYWIHNGLVNINNEKMSKSKGELILVRDIENKKAFRLFMLSSHYRSPINYSQEAIDNSAKEWTKIENTYNSLFRKIDLEDLFDESLILEDKKEELIKEMSKDLNTSNTIALLFNLVKEANKVLRKQSDVNITALFNTIDDVLSILGLNIKLERMPQEVKDLLKKWDTLKIKKNFEEADKVRDLLKERGII